ncbi:MAG: putative DNA-binding domain-containing protein [Arenibacterium sp.]
MTPAPILEDLFSAALLDASRPAPDGLLDGEARPAGKRFDVYRNNVAVSLGDAMLTGFPIVTKLLGEANMKGLAGIFLRAHPPISPLMMHYGEAFPQFIADLPQLKHLGYLPDVAWLELGLRKSYHAADRDPIAADQLAALPPDNLVDAQLGFAPAMIAVRSAWPLFDIWRFNTETDAPKPTPIAQDVLITRAEFDPVPQLLPVGGAVWIDAMQQGATIGAALELTQQTTPDFDLGQTLALLLQGNAITTLTTKEARS